MKTVIEMVKEAGGQVWSDKSASLHKPELERFAELVRADEREALEKIDWTVLLRQGALVTWGDAETLADRVIAAIRARGQS